MTGFARLRALDFSSSAIIVMPIGAVRATPKAAGRGKTREVTEPASRKAARAAGNLHLAGGDMFP